MAEHDLAFLPFLDGLGVAEILGFGSGMFTVEVGNQAAVAKILVDMGSQGAATGFGNVKEHVDEVVGSHGLLPLSGKGSKFSERLIA
jgi:hypothetical protein